MVIPCRAAYGHRSSPKQLLSFPKPLKTRGRPVLDNFSVLSLVAALVLTDNDAGSILIDEPR